MDRERLELSTLSLQATRSGQLELTAQVAEVRFELTQSCSQGAIIYLTTHTP